MGSAERGVRSSERRVNGELGMRNAERKSKLTQRMCLCSVAACLLRFAANSNHCWLLLEGEAALEHGEASIYHLGIVQPALVLLDLIERRI